MVYMPHLTHKKPITKAMKLSLHNLFQLDSLSLSVFSHQCDKWEFIPAGDEIFLPSLSLHPSFTTSLFLFLLCILTSPSSPVLHRAPSGVLSTFLCRFVSLFLRLRRSRRRNGTSWYIWPAADATPLKMSRAIKIHQAQHWVFLLLGEVEFRTTGYFQPQKIPTINYSNKLQRNLNAKKLDFFGQISY